MMYILIKKEIQLLSKLEDRISQYQSNFPTKKMNPLDQIIVEKNPRVRLYSIMLLFALALFIFKITLIATGYLNIDFFIESEYGTDFLKDLAIDVTTANTFSYLTLFSNLSSEILIFCFSILILMKEDYTNQFFIHDIYIAQKIYSNKMCHFMYCVLSLIVVT